MFTLKPHDKVIDTMRHNKNFLIPTKLHAFIINIKDNK